MADLDELLELVRRGFEGESFEAAEAFCDDATFRDNADRPTLRGRDEIVDHLSAYGGRRERASIGIAVHDGDRVAVEVSVRFQADSGAYAQRGLALVGLRDGRIASWDGVWIETADDPSRWAD
jgi:ketosteroid isomerase-like protein